jgi:DNA-binding transcriptional LysR family regulator
MELRHLRYFVAVAEELHFGRAAARLHMTQPPLSKQIQALERELGVTLFVRGRSITLTPAGASFLRAARRLLEGAQAAADAARQADMGRLRRLRVGYPATAALPLIAAALRTFEERYPNTVVDVRAGHTGPHLDGLRADELDVAFVQTAARWHSDTLALERLCEEPLLLALPVGHTLAARDAVPVELLAHESVILPPRALNPALADRLAEQVLAPAGAVPAALECTTVESALPAVANGLGVTLAPASITRALAVPGVVCVPLVPSPQVCHGLAWRDGAAPESLDAFLGVLGERPGTPAPDAPQPSHQLVRGP